MTPSLDADNLSFAYDPGAPAVSGVSAGLRAGSLLGIVGPNGSGKSTLLRMMAGLLTPDTGCVTLAGQPLRSIAAQARARQIAYLPQAVQPAFAFRVFEVVCLGRYPHTGGLGGLSHADLACAARCMDQTSTTPLRDRLFSTLSGGERQRVLLASILAQEPRFMLLDEPTSALDLHHAQEVFALLRQLAREDFGIAVVTHDLNLAAQYCDTLLLLGLNHQTIASGTVQDVLQEEALTSAYGAAMRVGAHPFAGTPFVCADPAGTAAP
jgi:iron complex transport system ATP-binding protein